jgi:hypothetical protein
VRFYVALAATLAYGLFLLTTFDVGVQGDSAAELVAGADEARKFLVADLAFPLFYALLLPLAALSVAGIDDQRAPRWVGACSAALVLGGLCDWAENVLLLASLETESPNRVDAAHAIATPKLIFCVIGAAGMLALLAVLLRRREPAG